MPRGRRHTWYTITRVFPCFFYFNPTPPPPPTCPARHSSDFTSCCIETGVPTTLSRIFLFPVEGRTLGTSYHECSRVLGALNPHHRLPQPEMSLKAIFTLHLLLHNVRRPHLA